jgi:integrase
MSRVDAWYMIQRRASDAKIETSIGCHTFRATGSTDYLTNGGHRRFPSAKINDAARPPQWHRLTLERTLFP